MRALMVVVAVLVCPGVASAEDAEPTGLALKRGTLQVGGTAAVVISSALSQTAYSGSSLHVSVTPTLGYFFTRGLEATFSLQLNLFSGSNYYSTFAESGWSAGASLGGRYHVSFGGSLSAYVGLELGGSVGSSPGKWAGLATIPLGLLVAVNRHVAIDVGLRGNLRWSREVVVSVPIGVFGVQTFF